MQQKIKLPSPKFLLTVEKSNISVSKKNLTCRRKSPISRFLGVNKWQEMNLADMLSIEF